MSAGIEATQLADHLKAYDREMAETRPLYERAEESGDYSHVDDVVTTLARDYVDVFASGLRPYLDGRLWNVEALQSHDPVKRDLELTCTLCREHICDVEPSDIFAVLLSTVIDHLNECPRGQEEQEIHP